MKRKQPPRGAKKAAREPARTVSVVGVHGRRVRIPRVQNQRHTRRVEIDRGAAREHLGVLRVIVREVLEALGGRLDETRHGRVDGGLFKNEAILEHAAGQGRDGRERGAKHHD